MKKDFNINQLDKTTLRFAIEKTWAFRLMCKDTKAGRNRSRSI